VTTSAWRTLQFDSTSIDGDAYADLINFFHTEGLPCLNKLDVVSHPVRACTAKICREAEGPSCLQTSHIYVTEVLKAFVVCVCDMR
jgi:hypothetical protein